MNENKLWMNKSLRRSIAVIVSIALIISCGIFIEPASASTDWRANTQSYDIGTEKEINFNEDDSTIINPGWTTVKGALFSFTATKKTGYRLDLESNYLDRYEVTVYNSQGNEIQCTRSNDQVLGTLTNGYIFPKNGTYYLGITYPEAKNYNDNILLKIQESSLLEGVVTDPLGHPIRLISVLGLNTDGGVVFNATTNSNGIYAIPIYNESIKLVFYDMEKHDFRPIYNNGADIAYLAPFIEGGITPKTITENVTMKYMGRSVAIFDSNGGSTVSPVIVDTDDKLESLPTTNRDGHTFLGWFDTSNNKASEDTVITDDITFTAKWSSKANNLPNTPKKVSANKNLKKIKKSTGKLNTKFKKGKKSYKLTISKKKKSVRIRPIKSDSKAKIMIKVGKGKYKNKKSVKVKLKKGKSKKVYIKVIAEDNTKKIYKIKVKRKR